MSRPKPSSFVKQIHSSALEALPFHDTQDFKDVERGLIARPAETIIKNEKGEVVWDMESYDFLGGEAPETVHPSLWRVSTLNHTPGLYEVVPGIYQVRGFDLSNLTVIEGEDGIIVLDVLTTKEPAEAAMRLYREHRGDKPVKAVIFTHSHADHFGGIFGVVSQEQIDSGEVQLIAPEGFLEHAVSENVYAGTAMARRAGYMYGSALDRGPWGQVGSGLGQATSTGIMGIAVPTHQVDRTGETMTVAGVEMEFQMAPNTEAPSEMHIFFPQHNALCIAENATHTLHNLLTLRGAVVRDPHVWSTYLDETIDLFADRSEVVFSPHHWPKWGKKGIREFLELQSELYAYLHDQTLRLINQGYQGAEIAEMITLPPALEQAWFARGYYGSVSHNVKAIYQLYMGWFDGNPARLWPHPPVEQAKRYVAAIGGVDRVVELAQEAYDQGDYRWAATLLDNAVFTEPENTKARTLYADTLDQMAYGVENATWRNFFLSGATELRGENFGTPTSVDSTDMLDQMTPGQIFDSIAIRIDGPKAWDKNLRFDVTFTDLGETYRLKLHNGTLTHRKRLDKDPAPQFTVKAANKLALLGLLSGSAAGIEVSGDTALLSSLVGVLDAPDPAFNIVLP